MKLYNTSIRIIVFILLPLLACCAGSETNNRKSTERHRVIVSSDIGGSDPDDFQSMVHLLLYADTLEIEGIISSPFDLGRKEHILQVIEYYEKDYENLKTYSDRYPTADSLRLITKQGGIEVADIIGYDKPTEGSEWIIQCARKNDPRPLHILVWGGIEDLAQALHDAPDILPKLCVYFIGGPNKKWSVNAYSYIANNFKNLWIIESNATYRGWFTGGNQSGEWGNKEFVSKHIKGKGALADFFITHLGGTIKMGDTPSLVRLLHGTPEDPSQPSWGGSYVRAWERPHKVFNRLTTEKDSLEEFGVLELRLPVRSKNITNDLSALMRVENQQLKGMVQNDTFVFLFSPKAAKVFTYTIESNLHELDGKTGSITSYLTPEENNNHPAPDLPNWWTDDPSPEFREGPHIGAKTVNRWREEFLTDFANRILRCKSPNSKVIDRKH